MKPVSLLTAALMATLAFPVMADSYTIDTRHTFPVFEVDHLGFSTQRGRFNKVTGRITVDAAQKQVSVDATIDAASIDMGLDAWDESMRAEKYFNTAVHPTIRFVATNIPLDLQASTTTTVDGQLTLLGVSRAIRLEVDKLRCGKHPMFPRQVCGADLRTRIKRSDFGMTHSIPGIGDEIRISIPVEAIKDS